MVQNSIGMLKIKEDNYFDIGTSFRIHSYNTISNIKSFVVFYNLIFNNLIHYFKIP